MPSQADVERFATANSQIRQLAQRTLRREWGTLTVTRDTVETVRDVLLAVVPEITSMFGEVAATVAADHYEAAREDAGVKVPHTTRVADPAPLEQVQASTRWAVAPLFTEDLDTAGTLSRLSAVVDRLSLEPSNNTILANVQTDRSDPKFARVPNGKTCAWCRMLASRGAVYASQASALTGRHDDCNCTTEPSWSDDDLPTHYDRDELYAEYAQARAAAGSDSPQAILAVMREQQGIH